LLIAVEAASISIMAMIMAAIMTPSFCAMPIAVITESMEKTISTE